MTRSAAIVDVTSGSVARRDLPTETSRNLHLNWWIAAAVLVVIVWGPVQTFLQSPNIDWAVVPQFVFHDRILHGLGNTLLLAVLAQSMATVLGLLIAFFALSRNPALRSAAWLYLWIIRAVPLVVQVLFWGNLALFAPVLALGIPGTDIQFFEVSTNVVVTAFVASLIALTLHDSAYMAEIIRSGLGSVEPSQREAATALGLSPWTIQRRVILPQAIKTMIPPSGNQFIMLLKATSIVVVIAGGDILTEAQNISAINLKTLELLIVASIWFLLVTSVLMVGQHLLERRFSRQNRDVGKPRKLRARGVKI